MVNKSGRIVSINLIILVVYFGIIILLKNLDSIVEWDYFEGEMFLLILITLQVVVNLTASIVSRFRRRELAATFLLSAGITLLIGFSGCFVSVLSL